MHLTIKRCVYFYSCLRISWSMQINYHSAFYLIRRKKSKRKVTSQSVTIENQYVAYDGRNFRLQNIYPHPTPDHSSLTIQNNNAVMTQYEMQKMQQ